MEGGLITIIITVITVLGSAGAWRYYENRLNINREAVSEQFKEDHAYRDDLRNRVAKLEQMLTDSLSARDGLLSEITRLTSEVSALIVKVEFLEKENDRLKNI